MRNTTKVRLFLTSKRASGQARGRSIRRPERSHSQRSSKGRPRYGESPRVTISHS